MDLYAWTINYVKSRDVFQKKLLSHEVKEGYIEFKFKDQTHFYFIEEKLTESILTKIENQNFNIIVCMNKTENLDFIVNKWSFFSKLKTLKLIFVSETTNDKWIICPYTHNLIADSATLKQGLKSMSDAAEGKFKDAK